MKRKIDQKSSIYAFIEPFLDKGEDAIRDAKRTYYRIYKAKWRNEQRRRTKQYTLAFSPHEAKEVFKEAKKAKRSVTAFIKASCFAYMNQCYLIPDPITLGEIRQLLAMNYNVILKQLEGMPSNLASVLLKQTADLEARILSKLHSPKSLENWVIEAIKEKPRYKETIFKLLNNVKIDS